jgi:hypothetical protein
MRETREGDVVYYHAARVSRRPDTWWACKVWETGTIQTRRQEGTRP